MYVAGFYKFALLDNYVDMKSLIYDEAIKLEIKGTFLVGEEGINASIWQDKDNIEKFVNFLSTDDRLKGIQPFYAQSLICPFKKMRVRLKNEIVRIGIDELDVQYVGKYLNSQEWVDLIKDPEVFLIDTRNHYETCYGKFKNAIVPDIENFRDFPQWVENWVQSNNITKKDKIAMYCTGGIRCEKTTAFFKSMGYENIFHLKGGILKYFADTSDLDDLWIGDCFVFDDRVLIDKKLNPVQLYCKKCSNCMNTEDMIDLTKGNLICLKCR
ncbi:hypothetical protein GUI12_03570 [Anaplasmataceae bacterium AB001_6]|nr:hypothetical protein GUI12_03570 [Anaplasmataceae bacterium AB001_6]